LHAAICQSPKAVCVWNQELSLATFVQDRRERDLHWFDHYLKDKDPAILSLIKAAD
jgi:hypothetical protein